MNAEVSCKRRLILLQDHVLCIYHTVLFYLHNIAAAGNHSRIPLDLMDTRLEVFLSDVSDDGTVHVHDRNLDFAFGLELDSHGRTVKPLDCRGKRSGSDKPAKRESEELKVRVS